MAKLKSLKEIFGNKAKAEFTFVDVLEDETRDGLPILRFILDRPMGTILGRNIIDPVSGDSARLEMNDVTVISMGNDVIEEVEKLRDKFGASDGTEGEEVIIWTTEGKAGTFKSKELKLDVSRNLEAWVAPKDGFAGFGRKRRAETNQKRTSTLVDKINANKTKKEFANTNVNANVNPEPVTVS